MGKWIKKILRNYNHGLTQTVHEWQLDGPIIEGIFYGSETQDGLHHRAWFWTKNYKKMIEHVFSEATKMIESETVHECPLDCPLQKRIF